VNEAPSLRLVVLYDANRNQYSLLAHNQSQEEANRIVEEQTAAECSGVRLIVLVQEKRHRVVDPENCQSCRGIAEDSAHLSPNPQFTRRNKS